MGPTPTAVHFTTDVHLYCTVVYTYTCLYCTVHPYCSVLLQLYTLPNLYVRKAEAEVVAVC